MARFIGIRHRTKKTKNNEARPTQVTVIGEDNKVTVYELETETDELDWLKGRLPVKYRETTADEDFSNFLKQQKSKKVVGESDGKIDPFASLFFHHQLKMKKVEGPNGKKVEKVVGIPVAYEGYRSGDTVGMIFGGSGSYFTFALSKVGLEIGAEVWRIPGKLLKKTREEAPKLQLVEDEPVAKKKAKDKKDQDSLILAEMIRDSRELFFKVGARDRDSIKATECLRARMDAMQDRIACLQRLHAKSIGMIFCTEDGGYPEGSIEKHFDNIKANDVILKNLEIEEARADKELEEALEKLEVYRRVFKPIEGMGPMIAARLICVIGDIRRFSTSPKLQKYCGVHVGLDGIFPRKRKGEDQGFHPTPRSGVFLLGDQFNRRPKSHWGIRLLEIKARYKANHPIPLKVTNKEGEEVTRYTDGHILRTALWRSRTKFIGKLFHLWWDLEREHQAKPDEQKAA